MKMYLAAVALALAAATTFIAAQEWDAGLLKLTVNDDGSMTVQITPAGVKKCMDEGGCRILTGKEMSSVITSVVTDVCGIHI